MTEKQPQDGEGEFRERLRNPQTLGRNKENNDAGRLLLAPLDKLTIEKDEFRDAINQILVACGTVTKENRELSETTALHQCTSTV